MTASSAPRVLIAGGGTGGHLFPGVALADELSERGVSVAFAGTSRGIEARIIPTTPYPLHLIDVAGLKGRGVWGLLTGFLRLPRAFFQTLALLRSVRPHVVVGVGGYASGPVVLVAALLGIPTMILEQNSIPGVTNRILSRLVRKVIITFPGASAFFPQTKVELLGNPIRRALALAARSETPTQPARVETQDPPLHILVLGGSQGARAVNDLVLGAVRLLAAAPSGLFKKGLSLCHQTGATDHARISHLYDELGLDKDCLSVQPFISDMAAAYQRCDLMIGRAGATTIAELTALGRPALLIPFPQAADDHQTHNALHMVQRGAARLLPQGTATAAELAGHIEQLFADRQELQALSAASHQLGHPEAAARIADRITDWLKSPPRPAP